MDINTITLFALTTGVIIFSPGASAILTTSKAASQGFARGMLTVAGFNMATTLYFVLSALGITAIIIASETLFNAIKWVGVAYLVYLAIGAIFTASGGLQLRKDRRPNQSRWSLVAQGFLIEFSNPKAVLYFSAVLPQFLNVNAPLLPQVTVMIAITIVLQWVIYGGYALVGDRIAKGGLHPNIVAWMNRFVGLALLYAAFKVATTQATR